jgi:hypothetical protein
MKKFLTLAVLLSGLSLGFAKNAKEVKTENSSQSTEKINSIVVDGNEKTVITKVVKQDSKGTFITWVHVEYYYTTTDDNGYVQVHYYSFDVPLP